MFGVEFWEKAGRWSEGLDAGCWVWIGEEFGGVWRLEGGWLLRRRKADFRGRRRRNSSSSHALSLVLNSEKKVAKERDEVVVLTGG